MTKWYEEKKNGEWGRGVREGGEREGERGMERNEERKRLRREEGGE